MRESDEGVRIALLDGGVSELVRAVHVAGHAVLRDQVAMPAPTAPNLSTPVTAGESVQLTWTGYSCPSGSGSPSAYNFTATNGHFPLRSSNYFDEPNFRASDFRRVGDRVP